MGHIELAAPVVHIWYLRGTRSWLAYLLGGLESREEIKAKQLEKVIYFAAWLVSAVDEDRRHLELPDLEKEYLEDRDETLKRREKEIKLRQKDAEVELKQLEKDGAKDSDIRARQKVIDKDIQLIGDRHTKDLDRLERAFETFQKLHPRMIIDDEELWREIKDRYEDYFTGGTGAESIKVLIDTIDFNSEEVILRDAIINGLNGKPLSTQRKQKAIKRLKIVASFNRKDKDERLVNNPKAMILDVIPVIPPELRPMVQLDGGRFATSDLNDLYRRVINRNNRLSRLLELGAPEIIVNNEKRMLQEAADALFDNGRRGRPVSGPGNRPLKSLSDGLKGKQGRFRENLLGKRVDYSARSVIVVGPELKLHQCGLPKKIALELFQPFIIRRLKELKYADTIKSAKKMLERKDDQVWDILEEVTKSHAVLLNRAPTLHRMGIQAFEPTLIEGNAIRIHPLVCKGFNADFDGDQMAVHLPLSIEAQVEATVLMMSTNNIFSPANGQPIITPSQDIVMGCYYLTATRGELGESGEKGEGMVFANTEEVLNAFSQNKLGVHARIHLRLPAGKKFISERTYIDRVAVEEHIVKDNERVITTVGRVIFNDALFPQMAYYDLALSSKQLSRIIADCYLVLGRRATIDLLDKMKVTGFRESTRSGLSFATDDLRTPSNKEKELKETDKEVEKFRRQFEDGNITERERYNKTLDLWTRARDNITKHMMEDLRNDKRTENGKQRPYLNPIFLMAHSGARGGIEQIRQLAGMRGLMAKPNGSIIETPIKANFKEGLSVLEYFSSTHGARKGLADTALKTADSGYLTRKLADVAQNVVVTMHDCGTTQGVTKSAIMKGEEIERSLSDTIRGRVSRNTIIDPRNNETIVEENEMLSWDAARGIEALGLDKVMVRGPMTCQALLGVCRLCYGMDLSTGALVEEGMAVGIIAAQSIGEPGTQLTMRTFHIGGVVKRELGESEMKNKKVGKVRFQRMSAVENSKKEQVVLGRNGEIQVLGPKGTPIETFAVPYGAIVLVKEGVEVQPGVTLCKWDPHITPLIADRGGKIKFVELIEGETLRKDIDEITGAERLVVMEHKGEYHPQIVIQDSKGQKLSVMYLPERAFIEVRDGTAISAGTIVAKTTRELGGTQDITGGLPRVTEIFEARKPRDPAVMSEVAGMVRVGDKKRNKRLIYVQPIDENGKSFGDEREHQVPPGKHLRVQSGDRVKEGDPLVYGPLVPHDILQISGIEAAQNYLVREVQNVYRSQRVDIDDKHIETIVSQMLRKVKVEGTGDSGLLPGSVIDKQAFNAVNSRLRESCKIKKPGDSRFKEGQIVPKIVYEEEKDRIEAEKGTVPTWTSPSPASCQVQLLGITKASVQSDSFISAASFQETTKVLTEAALAGKTDSLVGLKENVILGHLIPAGTGFSMHQHSQMRIRVSEEAIVDEEAELAEIGAELGADSEG